MHPRDVRGRGRISSRQLDGASKGLDGVVPAPGGGDEASGGDAAVAFLYGEDGAIAVPVGGASATAEFLDRWRVPGEAFSKQWEERFGEHAYLPLVEQADR